MHDDETSEEYDWDPGGLLTARPDDNLPDYHMRALIDFCKTKGISPEDISEEDLARFIKQ